MAVIPSAETGVDVVPTNSDSLWAMSALIDADWSSGCVVRTGWSNAVSRGKSTGEKRWGFLGKPVRVVEQPVLSIGSSEYMTLLTTMQRAGRARSYVPLYPDQIFTRSALSAGATILPVNPAFRRFFVNARLVISNPVTKAFEVVGIKDVVSGGLAPDGLIELLSPLSGSYPEGSMVMPLIEASLALQSRASLITDSIAEAPINAVELPGPWSLDGLETVGSNPVGFTVYQDKPILVPSTDWATSHSFEVVRDGDYAQSGITQIATVNGARAIVKRNFSLKFMDRESAWNFMRFFDSRGGSLHSFWLVSPGTEYKPSAVGFLGTTLQFKSFGSLADWQNRPYIAVINAVTGAAQVRKIINVVRNSGIDTVQPEEAFAGVTLQDRFCIAELARFDGDELPETWITDEHMTTEIRTVELLEEKPKTVVIPEIVTESLEKPFDPFCAEAVEVVNVPMFFYPDISFTTEQMPTGRAADLGLPETFSINIRINEMNVDNDFPDTQFGGSGVTAELLAALGGNYRVRYVGELAGTQRSRNWHHVRRDFGGNWVLSGVLDQGVRVRRYLWQATRTFTNASAVVKTITVRVVAEVPWDFVDNHILDDQGITGMFFAVNVFSNEVNPSYTDGATVTVKPGVTTTFSYDDPTVWGGAIAGGTQAEKFFHPQLLLSGNFVTSGEAPLYNEPGSCQDDVRVRGLGSCLSGPNGLPWTSINDSSAALNNSVFGNPLSGGSGMVTLGGGCPTSEIIKFIVLENGRKANGDTRGRTALYPSRAGWNEEVGSLNMIGGSSLGVDITLPRQTPHAINCCEGYPGYEIGEYGGTPTCWKAPPGAPVRSDAGPEVCCIRVDQPVLVTLNNVCVRRDFLIGSNPFTFECDYAHEQTYSLSGSKSVQHSLPLCEVNFQTWDGFAGANLRTIKWALGIPDPDYVYANFSDDFNGAGDLLWGTEIGTWARNGTNSTFELISVDVGTVLNWVRMDEYGSYKNVLVQGKSSVGNRFLGCITESPSGSVPVGYGFLANAEQGKIRVILCKPDGTYDILREETVSPFTAPYTWSFKRDGPLITATVNGVTVQVSDCQYYASIGGYVGFIAEAETDPFPDPAAIFDDFSVEDLSPDILYIEASYSVNGWTISAPKQLLPYYNGGCAHDPDATCGQRDFGLGWSPDAVGVNQITNESTIACPPSRGNPEPYAACEQYDSVHYFIAAQVRVQKRCDEPGYTIADPPGDDACTGMDWWTGVCLGLYRDPSLGG